MTPNKKQTQRFVNNIPNDKVIGLSKDDFDNINNCTSMKEIREILWGLFEKEGIKKSKNNRRKKKKPAKRKFPKKQETVQNRQKKLTLEERLNEFRKELVKNQTQSEIKFKQLLSQHGVEYVFQHIIHDFFKGYIADFYLTRQNIVIEIDGGYHNNELQMLKDEERTQFMLSHGVHKVIRFKNSDLSRTSIQKTSKALEAILNSH